MEEVIIVSDISKGGAQDGHKGATYCIKALVSGRKVTYTGVFKKEDTTDNLEALAVYMGIYSLVSTHTFPPGTLVRCYTDMLRFARWDGKTESMYRQIQHSIRRLQVAHRIIVDVDWVGNAGGASRIAKLHKECHNTAVAKLNNNVRLKQKV